MLFEDLYHDFFTYLLWCFKNVSFLIWIILGIIWFVWTKIFINKFGFYLSEAKTKQFKIIRILVCIIFWAVLIDIFLINSFLTGPIFRM